MCAVPPDLVVACDDIRAYDNGVSGSYGLLYFKNPMPSCPVDVRTVLELNMVSLVAGQRLNDAG